MGVAWHRRPVVHISGDTLDNRSQNLRPARDGEIVTTYNKTYAMNELGQYAQDLIVKGMYRDRNSSPQDAERWKAYCDRGK